MPTVVVLALITTYVFSPSATKSPPAASPSASVHPKPSPSGTISTALDYPLSRFQAGRPSAVTGLTAVSADEIHKTVRLKWNPNPASEYVDSYALYYSSGYYFYPSGDRIGILAAVVKTSEMTTQIVGVKSTGPSGFEPYGANEIPICNVPDSGCDLDHISIWVIAHNVNGWGDNDFTTPNPDENPANFSELSFEERNKIHLPTALDLSLSTLNANFESGFWPAYSTDTDIQTLSNLAAPRSEWTVPWLPEIDLPLTRFQDGRPGGVTNSKLVSLDERTNSLTIHWNSNPAGEKVDLYAVYITGSNCPDDFCYSQFLAVQSGTTYKATFNLSDSSIEGYVDSKPHLLHLAKGRHYNFLVVAHNAQGWSNNDPFTPNPDQSDRTFRYLTANQKSKYDQNFGYLGVDIL